LTWGVKKPKQKKAKTWENKLNYGRSPSPIGWVERGKKPLTKNYVNLGVQGRNTREGRASRNKSPSVEGTDWGDWEKYHDKRLEFKKARQKKQKKKRFLHLSIIRNQKNQQMFAGGRKTERESMRPH